MFAKVWRVIEWVLVVMAIGVILGLERVNNWQARRTSRSRKK